MKRSRPIHLSIEELREQELTLRLDEESDYSDLGAEQELDFEKEQFREYQPEVWEVDNDDDAYENDSQESV